MSNEAAVRFYTRKSQVPLKPGETLGFKKGHGYYAKPKPKPAKVSPFAGVGVFTAWDSVAAIGLKADWVAVQLDPEGGHTATVAALKDDGKYARVFGWQARPDAAGVQRCRDLGCDGYIGQAESEAQLAACTRLGAIVGLPQALVGNVGSWSMDEARRQRWELILECYENANPGVWDRLDSRGYPVASTLYGCYDASTERLGMDIRDATPEHIARELDRGSFRIALSGYRAHYPQASWCVYLAETLTEDDRKALGA